MSHKLSRVVLVLAVATLMVATACAKKTTTTTKTACPKPAAAASFGVTCDETVAAEVPSDVRTKGTLTVAADATYAPDEFLAPDNKTIIGMDADLGSALATVLGLKFNFQNATFDTIIPGLASGKFDIGMSSFTDNKEREKTVDFVTYFQAGASIFVASSSSYNFKTLDELCGKAVSVESGTTELDDVKAASTKCVSESKKKIDYKVYSDQNQTNLAVINGRVVASLADSQVAAYQVKVTNGAVKVTGDYLAPAPYGIAIARPQGAAPGTGPMTKPILDALKTLFASGAYTKILDQWGVAAGAITAPQINGAQS